jgi:hypothetical protein
MGVLVGGLDGPCPLLLLGGGRFGHNTSNVRLFLVDCIQLIKRACNVMV